jgi:hypothetical protein
MTKVFKVEYDSVTFFMTHSMLSPAHERRAACLEEVEQTVSERIGLIPDF